MTVVVNLTCDDDVLVNPYEMLHRCISGEKQ